MVPDKQVSTPRIKDEKKLLRLPVELLRQSPNVGRISPEHKAKRCRTERQCVIMPCRVARDRGLGAYTEISSEGPHSICMMMNGLEIGESRGDTRTT